LAKHMKARSMQSAASHARLRLLLSASSALMAVVASFLLIGFWLGLIGLGFNAGLMQGGWFLYGIALGELLLVGVVTGLMPDARGPIPRLSVYAAMAWLMVGANVLLFTFVIHIY
jgi:hypothetical protein